jgi:hypothetical protein
VLQCGIAAEHAGSIPIHRNPNFRDERPPRMIFRPRPPSAGRGLTRRSSAERKITAESAEDAELNFNCRDLEISACSAVSADVYRSATIAREARRCAHVQC